MPGPSATRRGRQCLLQSWGGEEALSENKLWSAAAAVFHAPTTMTNRSLKMRQLWAGFHLTRLACPEAVKMGVHAPPFDSTSFFSRKSDLVTVWPSCLRTELTAEDDIGRASNRGAFQASAPGASRGQPLGQTWSLGAHLDFRTARIALWTSTQASCVPCGCG